MIKKLFLLSSFVLSAYAMETSRLKDSWSSWVKNTSRIYMRTRDANYTGEITDDSTILDLKEELDRRKDIPVEAQSVRAVWVKWGWRGGYCERMSPCLQDEDNIKDVMHVYNTDMFELYWHTRK